MDEYETIYHCALPTIKHPNNPPPKEIKWI